FRPGDSPVTDLATPAGIPTGARAPQLQLLERLNREQLEGYRRNTELEARIADFDIAARMHAAVPEALDPSREMPAPRKLYGLDLDHQQLTYPHDGRPGSLTDVSITKAKVEPRLLA